MTKVYVVIATMTYEFSEVIGVFDNKDDAHARCLAANDGRQDGLFDYATIETWELGALQKIQDDDLRDFIQLRERD